MYKPSSVIFLSKNYERGAFPSFNIFVDNNFIIFDGIIVRKLSFRKRSHFIKFWLGCNHFETNMGLW